MSTKTNEWVQIAKAVVIPWENEVDRIYLNAQGNRHHEKHINTGIKLLRYFIPKDAVHFPILNEAFYMLGKAVSYIMEKFHNSGVSTERHSWLGRTVEDYDRETLEVSFTFLPSNALQEILPDHMTDREKMILYITYLEGMQAHYENRHEYNRQDAEGPVVVSK